MADRGDIVFGVYGVDDLTTNSYLQSAITSDENTLSFESTWIAPANFDLTKWVQSISDRYNFMATKRALVFFEWGLVEVTLSRSKLTIEVNGKPEGVEQFIKTVDGVFPRAENLIEWIYGSNGESISVPLNFRPAIEGAYPWLPKPLNEYIDDYMDSDASVLILLGPPGTGKTTFIKNLIHRSGADARVTYDEKVMNSDSLFASFIDSHQKFLIMEDADVFLQSRTEGNTMMHRFLNVSDGLISAKDKKLVFSTNLPSIRDIDSALLRPGRCFDVIEFRALTRAEAKIVAAERGLELPDGDEFTLAEVFNEQPSSETRVTRSVGFI